MLQEENEEAAKLKAQRVAEYSARKSKSKYFVFMLLFYSLMYYFTTLFRTYSYCKVEHYIRC